MWFCLPLSVILFSFEFIKLSTKRPFDFCSEIDIIEIQLLETFETKLWKTSIFRRVAGCKKFLKVSHHFNKIPNSLRQEYSEICIFLCAAKKSLPEAVSKDWSQSAREILWWNWWRCDEIHIIVNLGQKYEGNLGY